MNNTINANLGANNISNPMFKARYLHINNPEKMPLKIYSSIYKSEGVDEFLAAGQPKTFWQQVKDLFKKNEILTVDYTRDCHPSRRFESGDHYQRSDEILFSYGKEGTFYQDRKKFKIFAEQDKNSINNTNLDAVEENLAQQIVNIKNLGTLLK